MKTSSMALLVACCAVLATLGRPHCLPVRAAEPLPRGAITRIGTTQFRQVSWHKRVFFSSDWNSLIVTDDRNKVRWWDPTTGERVHEIEMPNAQFNGADFAPSSGLLAVIGTQRPEELPATIEQIQQTVWLIDTATRQVVHTLPMKGSRHAVFFRIQFTPDAKRLVTALDDEIRVWDVKTGDELIRLKVPAQNKLLAVSSDGKAIAYGAFDVYLWRWEAGDEPKKFAGIGNFGMELAAFTPDGKSLYVEPQAGGPLRVFDVASGRQTGTLDIGGLARTLSISPDGTTLAAGYAKTNRRNSREQTVTLWDLATGAERRQLPLGQMSADHVSWSSDGTRLAAGSDSRIWAWDVATGKTLCHEMTGHAGTITALAFAPDGSLFTASDDHTIRSWDAATGRPGLTLLHDHWVRGLAVSPDGTLVAGSSLRNDLRIWDAKTGQQRLRLLGNGEMGGKRSVAFASDGKQLVAWGDDDTLRVWDVRNGKLLAETRPDGEAGDSGDPRAKMLRAMRSQSGFAVSPDGETVALSSATVVRVLDAASGKERFKLDIGPGGAMHLAFSPDAKSLALSTRAKPTQTKLPDGRMRMSTADEHLVAVWDMTNRSQLWTATAEGVWPSALMFTPDGTRVAATAQLRNKPSSVRFWEATSGKDSGRVELPDAAGAIAFDREGKRLGVALRDTTAIVYDLATALQPAPAK